MFRPPHIILSSHMTNSVFGISKQLCGLCAIGTSSSFALSMQLLNFKRWSILSFLIYISSIKYHWSLTFDSCAGYCLHRRYSFSRLRCCYTDWDCELRVGEYSVWHFCALVQDLLSAPGIDDIYSYIMDVLHIESNHELKHDWIVAFCMIFLLFKICNRWLI